jgi:hypothetical protein
MLLLGTFAAPAERCEMYPLGTRVTHPPTLLVLLQVTTEQFLEVPWPFIQQTLGGSYTITISGARTRLMYELKVGTARAQVLHVYVPRGGGVDC